MPARKESSIPCHLPLRPMIAADGRGWRKVFRANKKESSVPCHLPTGPSSRRMAGDGGRSSEPTKRNPPSPAICRQAHHRGGWQGLEEGLQSQQERNLPSPAICRQAHDRGGWQGMEEGLQSQQKGILHPLPSADRPIIAADGRGWRKVFRASKQRNPPSPAICRQAHHRGGWQGMEEGLQSQQERNPPSPAICRQAHHRGGWQGMEEGLQSQQARESSIPCHLPHHFFPLSSSYQTFTLLNISI